jgi:hypothetical protein
MGRNFGEGAVASNGGDSRGGGIKSSAGVRGGIITGSPSDGALRGGRERKGGGRPRTGHSIFEGSNFLMIFGSLRENFRKLFIDARAFGGPISVGRKKFLVQLGRQSQNLSCHPFLDRC